MFRKILIATDLSNSSESAMMAGATLAERCEAELLVLYVETRIHLHAPEGSPETQLQDRVGKYLSQHFPAMLWSSEIVEGMPPSPEILDYARSHGCDLVVVGRHGHSMRHFFLGSVAQEMIRNIDIPVLVVPKYSEDQRLAWRKILIPTDFSEASMKALEWGIRLGRFLGSQLDFVHVLDLPGLEEIHTAYMMKQLKMAAISTFNVPYFLERVLKLHEWEGVHKVVRLEGDPPVEILRYAEENHTDLIVMGTHGRKSLERVLVGSVTATVISHTPIPVFTIARH